MVSSSCQMSLSRLAVDEFENLVENALRREQTIGRIVRREKGRNFIRELFALPDEVMPVSRLLVAAFPAVFVLRMISKVEDEALRFNSFGDRRADQAACFHHLVSADAVEVGESGFADELLDERPSA